MPATRDRTVASRNQRETPDPASSDRVSPDRVSPGRVSPDRVALPEAEAQAVAWIRSIEENDRKGILLPLARRREATAAALAEMPHGDLENERLEWIPRRARALAREVGAEHPAVGRLLRWTRPFRGLTPAVFLLSGCLGLLTQALERGEGRLIQVLAVPLLGLVAWNLLMMALLLVRRWLPVGGLGSPLVDSLLELWQRGLRQQIPSTGPDVKGALARAAGGYLELWLPAVSALAAARVRRLLHLSAAALVLGVVLGMYLRGLVWEYRMTWESTFLSAATVGAWLERILGPASALLGIPVPDVTALRSPGSGPAAPWIHLYGATALLFAVLPRLALATAETLRCRRLGREVSQPFPLGARRRLLAAVSTQEHRVDVWPVSFRPVPRAVTALRSLFLDLLGPRTQVRVGDPVPYDTDPQALGPLQGRLLVALFNLAQPPESEVHGELLGSLRNELGDGQSLVAAVDASAYRLRIHGDDPAAAEGSSRLRDRRRNWDRVVREQGLEALHLDLQDELPEDLLARVTASSWPSGSLGGR